MLLDNAINDSVSVFAEKLQNGNVTIIANIFWKIQWYLHKENVPEWWEHLC